MLLRLSGSVAVVQVLPFPVPVPWAVSRPKAAGRHVLFFAYFRSFSPEGPALALLLSAYGVIRAQALPASFALSRARSVVRPRGALLRPVGPSCFRPAVGFSPLSGQIVFYFSPSPSSGSLAMRSARQGGRRAYAGAIYSSTCPRP
jgi:hypothetical protein